MQDDPGSWYGPEQATFGDRLAAAREQAGMDQAKLSRRLGVKQATLRKWEEDLAEPRANRLQMLAGLLNVSVVWLLTGEGDGPDGPPADAPLPDSARDLLLEVREMKSEMTRAAQRLGRLEKALRNQLGTQA